MLQKITIVFAIMASGETVKIEGKRTIRYYTDLYFNTYFPKHRKMRGENYGFQNHLRIFLKNIERMYKLNVKNSEFQFGFNQFTDLNFKDFEANYTGFRQRSVNYKELHNYVYKENVDLPEVMLGHKSVMEAPVSAMDQLSCSSSYAYSVIAAIESYLVLNYQNVSGRPLSRQQGLDCTRRGSCFSGGSPRDVLDSVKKAGGVNLDSEYPRQEKGHKQPLCTLNMTTFYAKLLRYDLFLVKDEKELAQALFLHGPLVTTIYASPSVRDYESGVLNPTDCKSDNATHAILLIGYGKSMEGTPYWLLMNSWGDKWGSEGYLYLAKDVGACRIGKDFNAAVIAEPADKSKKKRVTTAAPVFVTNATSRSYPGFRVTDTLDLDSSLDKSYDYEYYESIEDTDNSKEID